MAKKKNTANVEPIVEEVVENTSVSIEENKEVENVKVETEKVEEKAAEPETVENKKRIVQTKYWNGSFYLY